MSEALLVAAPARAPAATDATAPRCQNCGAALAGPYCASCGQRHEPHIHSLGHFIAEASENLTHADSRLWRTLGALLARPGHLTREFIAGRRERYLPPFRLYLVVSVVFFVLLAVLPDGATPINVETRLGESTAAARGVDTTCTNIDYQGPGEAWLKPALLRACNKVAADDGRGLLAAFTTNVPRALFFFLPLIASVALLLYWRPRRYYVEHLLFFIHNHSAVFVAFGVFSALTAMPLIAAVEGVLVLALAIYLLWYTFRGMRVVYGQSRGRTLAKYGVLLLAYLLLGSLTLLATGVLSAFTL